MTDVIVKFEYNENKTWCKAYFIHEGQEYKATTDRWDKYPCISYERSSFNRLEIMVNTMYPNKFNLKTE